MKIEMKIYAVACNSDKVFLSIKMHYCRMEKE